MANCRTCVEKEHAGVSVRAQHLGTRRSRARDSSRRMEQPKRQEVICGRKRGRVMKIEVFADADAVAQQAAGLIAAEARAAVAAHGSFVMAVSGGHTPSIMLRNLAQEHVPWNAVPVVQVDGRVAPRRNSDGNL